MCTLMLAGCASFSPTATDAEGVLREVATKLGKDRCVSQTLKLGDRDGDSQLSRVEFEEMALMAMRGMIKGYEGKLEYLDSLQAVDRTVDAAGERRRELESQLARGKAELETKARPWARERFGRFDADRSGLLSTSELADGCAELGAS